QEPDKPLFHERVNEVAEECPVSYRRTHAAEKVKVHHTGADTEPVVIPPREKSSVRCNGEVADIPIDKDRQLHESAVSQTIAVLEEYLGFPPDVIHLLSVFELTIVSTVDLQQMVDVNSERLRIVWKQGTDRLTCQVKARQFSAKPADVMLFQLPRQPLIDANGIVKHHPRVHDTLLVMKRILLVVLRQRPRQEIFEWWREVVAKDVDYCMVLLEMFELSEEGALRNDKSAVVKLYTKHVVGGYHRTDVDNRPHCPRRIVSCPCITDDARKIDVAVHGKC